MFFKDAQKKWRHSILLIGRKLYVRQISYVYTHLLFYFFFFILFYSVNYKYKNIKKIKKWAFKNWLQHRHRRKPENLMMYSTEYQRGKMMCQRN